MIYKQRLYMKKLIYTITLLLIIPTAQSDIIVLNDESSGSYKRDGNTFTHESDDDIFRVLGTNQQRAYFTFNLSGISAPIVNATIEFLNPVVSGTGDIDLRFKAIDNDLDLITQTVPNTNFKNHYRDLGKGTKFNPNIIGSTTFQLNANGLAEIESSLGQLFAIGIRTRSDDSFLSHDGARLTLTTATPEPEEVILLLLSICVIVAFKNKKPLKLSEA
jgi:hypothetical protein